VSPEDQHRIANGELSRLVAKHERILAGNGEAGLVARVIMAEKTLASIIFYAKWIIVFLGGILLTSLAHLIIK
jgi:hypothetical protein